jgi:pimeloyl-ACP methyl ester carboxylesterase
MFVLIHSPLVGTFTWSRVAAEMQRRGIEVLVPALRDDPGVLLPFWEQHAQSFARALGDVPPDTELILVGHSGAGPLLPALRAAIPHKVKGYVFVDAGIPQKNKSRLAMMAAEDAAWTRTFEAYLWGGGTFPNWNEDALREIVPDEATLRTLIQDIRPRGLLFFQEPLPVFDGFPDAPCAHLQFSAPYQSAGTYAREHGWAYKRLNAGHFHMLVDPVGVTDALTNLTGVQDLSGL